MNETTDNPSYKPKIIRMTTRSNLDVCKICNFYRKKKENEWCWRCKRKATPAWICIDCDKPNRGSECWSCGQWPPQEWYDEYSSPEPNCEYHDYCTNPLCDKGNIAYRRH